MPDEQSTALVDPIFSLLDRLRAAHESGNRQALTSLSTTFSELLEASYALNNRAFSSILEDMECMARDSITGIPWKSKVPTKDEIISALADLEH